MAVPVFRPDGRKLLPRGRRLGEEELVLLESAGVGEIWVAELESGEVSEDEAIARLAPLVAAGPHARRPGNGFTDFLAQQPGTLTRNHEVLRHLNTSGVLVLVGLRNFSYGPAGTHFARLRTHPFSVCTRSLESAENLLRLGGPGLEWRPLQQPRVAVLYVDPISPERARGLFQAVVRQRLERYGVTFWQEHCREDEADVRCHLTSIVRKKPELVLIASTTCPAGPNDAIGRAMQSSGGRIESFLAPVEPGSLLLLGYHGESALVSAPGCFRSHQLNVLDLLLPALLARYRVNAEEVAELGAEGLLQPLSGAS